MSRPLKLTANAFAVTILVLTGIFLTGCGSPSSSTGSGFDAVTGAQLTISAANASTVQAQAVIATSTAAAVYAVQTVDASTREAATAAAVQTVDAQALIDADMTRTFAVATLERDQQLDAVEDRRVDLEIQSREQALAAAEQLNAQIVADNARRLEQAAVRRDQQAELSRLRSFIALGLLLLLGIALFFFLMTAVAERFHRMIRRDQALRILQGGSAPAPTSLPASTPEQSRGRLTISAPPPSTGSGSGVRIAALPANQRAALLQGEADRLRGSVANWGEFAKWRRPDRVPIGVGANGPILFDLSLLPHIFAAGATRKGKSTLLRVLLAYMATSGFNVVILNERSSDFAALSGLPNVMNLRGFSTSQRLRLAQDAFRAAVEEMGRRDAILHAEGVPTWREYLSRNPAETPLTFLFVDEFLELTQGNRSAQDALMRDALTLSSQAGKFGLGIGLNATDPTQRALGEVGYGVVQNCARICLGVNSTYASMSVLGDTSAFGLPSGQFIAIDHDGQRHDGVGFNPAPEQLSAYIREREPSGTRPFPVALAAVSRSFTEEETREDLDTSDPELSRIIEDSRIIAALSGSGRVGRSPDSRSAICEILFEQGHIGWGRTGPNIRRVELALTYLASKGDRWAQGILVTSRSSTLTPEDAPLVNRLRTVEAAAD